MPQEKIVNKSTDSGSEQQENLPKTGAPKVERIAVTDKRHKAVERWEKN